ncbi:hypothetical protein EV426DRAFT_575198 [Tirmania nivea]|nr:hypothetical protein EV426DRAFT_575198 [Tirmania nivea]
MESLSRESSTKQERYSDSQHMHRDGHTRRHSRSPASTHVPGYSEHNHAGYTYAYSQHNVSVGSAQIPHGDLPNVPQQDIRRSRTGPDMSPSAAYITPILPEHRGSILRARRSIGNLAKGSKEEGKCEVGDGEVRYSNIEARPYIAPILPEHRRGILKARRQAEKEHRNGVNGTKRRISPSQRGEGGREHPREQYPKANPQDIYRGYPRDRESQRGPGSHWNTLQGTSLSHYIISPRLLTNADEPVTYTGETPVYAHWRPNHEPTDDEFDYIYEPEGRILTENPNPTRK